MSFSGKSPANADGGGDEIMLFGVRVKVDSMRKSVSMNNLSEYEPISNTSENCAKVLPEAAKEGGVAAGYASADDVAPQPSAGGGGERKRGQISDHLCCFEFFRLYYLFALIYLFISVINITIVEVSSS